MPAADRVRFVHVDLERVSACRHREHVRVEDLRCRRATGASASRLGCRSRLVHDVDAPDAFMELEGAD